MTTTDDGNQSGGMFHLAPRWGSCIARLPSAERCPCPEDQEPSATPPLQPR